MKTIYFKPHHEPMFRSDTDKIHEEVSDLIENIELKTEAMKDGYINDIRVIFSRVMEITKNLMP